MQHLDTLWKVLSAASTVRDMALESKTYTFAVSDGVTFYLHAAEAAVRLQRHALSEIIVKSTLQAGFGWRVQTDQDEAGVYLVARRRTLVGGISRASFVVTVPESTYVILKLDNTALQLDDLNGEYHIDPHNRIQKFFHHEEANHEDTKNTK